MENKALKDRIARANIYDVPPMNEAGEALGVVPRILGLFRSSMSWFKSILP